MSSAPVINDDFPGNVRAAINAAFQACFDAMVHQANSYTTAGIATALTLTPTPALAANAANVRYNITTSIASGANPTLAVSGQPALPIMQYSAAGTLVAASFVAGLVTDIICDGTHWIMLTPSLANLVGATATFSGAVTALQFNGSGAGLTGTASSLTAGAANAVAWGNVSGHPTDLGSFSNGPGYVGVSAFSASTSGYIKFSDGFMIQWSTIAASATSGSFPVSFPNACLCVTGVESGGTATFNTSTVTVGAVGSIRHYIAIGY